MTTTLLIDGDPVAYQCSATNQIIIDWGDGEPNRVVDEDATRRAVDEYIEHLQETLEADKVIIALSCPTPDGWRRRVYPPYKTNRKTKDRPLSLKAAMKHLMERWNAKREPELEADDILGILATREGKGKKIIVSIDKDMRQIPGLLYNPNTKKLVKVTPREADRFHMLQTLTGDYVDGYKGLPGIGPVKANMLFDNNSGMSDWDIVRVAYGLGGLDEEDALIQARVSRILRDGEFNASRGGVQLWTP